MEYQFFSNTAIQYFGDPDLYIEIEGPNGTVEVPEYGEATLEFAQRLFLKEWLPISLDGQRNLLRVYFGFKGGKIYNVFAIDTNIRDIGTHTTSLTDNDIRQSLPVIPELKEYLSEEELRSSIPIHYQTKEYVEEIYERKRDDLVQMHSSYADFNPVAAYKLLIAACIKYSNNKFLPTVTILTDRTAAAKAIDTSLIIDLGNSRTIGLFVEKDVSSQKYHLDNAAPLRLIDYNKLEEEGAKYLSEYEDTSNIDEFDYLIGSMMRFKKNIFDKYIRSETGSFALPSLVAIGTEAESMEGSILDNSSIGISGPKRYEKKIKI